MVKYGHKNINKEIKIKNLMLFKEYYDILTIFQNIYKTIFLLFILKMYKIDIFKLKIE